MTVDYVHDPNLHTVSGPRRAFGAVFAERLPASVLDVGCGPGTWLRAALDAGINDVVGVDGVDIPREKLLIPPEVFRHVDLTREWSLGRRFDAAVCVEVAEHLDERHAAGLVKALTAHADTIYFSAACPGQTGQNHVNCQWPRYWQELFNGCGYECDDSLRWRIWDIADIEPWYRQNLFVARRSPATAGSEPRIPSVVHPDMLSGHVVRSRQTFDMERGRYPVRWYFRKFWSAIWKRMARPDSRST